MIFIKESPQSPVYDTNGRPIPFVVIDNSWGYIDTEDGWLINQLQNAVARKVGGVILASREEVDELVRGKTSGRRPNQRDEIRAMPFVGQRPIPNLGDAGRVADANTTRPIDASQRPDPFKAPVAPPRAAVPLEIPKLPKVQRNPVT